MEDEVGIYDSAFDDLPHNEQLVVASLVKTEKKILKAKFSNVYMQTNGNDCGLYAIANATALAFGRDPSKEQYIPIKLREHLIQCLENKEMRPFPTAKGTSKRRKAIKKTENFSYTVFAKCLTHTLIIFFVTNVLMIPPRMSWARYVTTQRPFIYMPSML